MICSAQCIAGVSLFRAHAFDVGNTHHSHIPCGERRGTCPWSNGPSNHALYNSSHRVHHHRRLCGVSWCFTVCCTVKQHTARVSTFAAGSAHVIKQNTTVRLVWAETLRTGRVGTPYMTSRDCPWVHRHAGCQKEFKP